MTGKVTLITPPDIYENFNLSFLLVNLKESDQITFSEYLGKKQNLENINLYFYSSEDNPNWFFHALARSEYKYIDIDNLVGMPYFLLSYTLGKNNVFFKTQDESIAAICQYINQNRVKSIEQFLDFVFKDQNEK